MKERGGASITSKISFIFDVVKDKNELSKYKGSLSRINNFDSTIP